MMRRGISVADLTWVILGSVLALTLFVPPSHVGERVGIRRYLTPEIGTEWQLTQRFRVDRPQFNGIAVHAAAVAPVGGRVALTLRDRDARGVERTAEVDAGDLVRQSAYVFRFDPIEASVGHEFELQIGPADDGSRGVALWANKGPREPDGALSINGERRWGSLAFQTYSPATSLFNRLISPEDPERPPSWLALAGLLGGWVALRFVLRGVSAHAPAAADPSRPAPLET